jgi:hypothetical protein
MPFENLENANITWPGSCSYRKQAENQPPFSNANFKLSIIRVRATGSENQQQVR